jgi:hypothetical protein
LRNQSRTIRETGLYDAAIALFSVLLGLALLHPFERFAIDVTQDPLHGAWTSRLLFVGLGVRAILYFHALISEMTLMPLVEPSTPANPARPLPGSRERGSTYSAMGEFWTGGLAVTLFFVAGFALDHGVATFLAWFGSYVVLDLAWELVYLRSEQRWTRTEITRLRHRPWSLARLLVEERRIPMSLEDVDAERGLISDPATFNAVSASWVHASLWWTALDVTALAFYGALITIALTLPGAATIVAAVWLAEEVAATVADYVLFPQLYAA